LPGTIHTAAAEIEAAGGKALAVQVDIREEDQVIAAVAQAVAHFGGIDILINNASAVNVGGTLEMSMKRYDLMHQVNARGTFLCSQKCLPHLLKAENPHILMLSPPLDMKEKWFASFTGYSMAKFGMSLVVLGLAGETRGRIAVNALWPRTTVATAAVKNVVGGDALMRMSRTPEILADAAYAIFNKPKSFTGNFLIDDTFLAGEGVTDFDQYRADPTQRLQIDFFVPDDVPPPPGATFEKLR
jgi:citronellol/citronellal dehydrogenase